MTTELERRKGETDDHSEDFNRVRKYKKEAIRVDEYNNWGEKYTSGKQQHVTWPWHTK